MSDTPQPIPSTDFHRNIGGCLRRVAVGKETLVIVRHGFREAVRMPADEYGRLTAERRQLAREQGS